MNYIKKSSIFACVLLVESVCAALANFGFTPNVATQDPATSMNCFTDYIALSKQVNEIYGQNYKKCLLDAQDGRKAIEAQMSDKRIGIVEGSQSVCQRLSACDGLNTTLEIFNCHDRIGSNNTKDVYEISSNASEYSTELQEKYRSIDLSNEQCSKTAERSYVEATGANYRNLQNCLDGRIKTTLSITTPTSSSTTNTTPLSIALNPHTLPPFSKTSEVKPLSASRQKL